MVVVLSGCVLGSAASDNNLGEFVRSQVGPSSG